MNQSEDEGGPSLEVLIDEYVEMAAKLPTGAPTLVNGLIAGPIEAAVQRPRLAAEQPPAVRVRQIVKALKNQRTRRGLTIEQVAEASGVHKSVISRFENTSADPHLSTMLRYADAIGVDFTVLLDGNAVLHYDEQVLESMILDSNRAMNEAFREFMAEYVAEHPNEIGIRLRSDGPRRTEPDSPHAALDRSE